MKTETVKFSEHSTSEFKQQQWNLISKWCYVKILTHLKINLSSLVRTTFYDVLVHVAEMKITCFLERSFLLTP